jgi:predicted metal-dependent hydrolase
MTNEKLESLTVNGREIALVYVKHRRARRYVLRLRSDATAQVTIPRGGSAAEGRRFAERHQGWLERQLQRLAERPRRQLEWVIGTEILFRGAQASSNPREMLTMD